MCEAPPSITCTRPATSLKDNICISRSLHRSPGTLNVPAGKAISSMGLRSLLRKRLQARRAGRHREHMAPATPSIMGIPPELRLMIFSYVLPPGMIKVDKTYKPPALLQVNRRIRNETQEIYYSRDCKSKNLEEGNLFLFTVHNCKPRSSLSTST